MYQYRESIDILLIEDNSGDARLIYEILREATSTRFNITHVSTLKDALSKLEEREYDVALLDLNLPDSTGFDTFLNLKENHEGLACILLTGLNDEAITIRTIQNGAQDFLNKEEVTRDILVRSIFYAIERNELLLQLKAKSVKDDLTGLYNRRGFFELSNKIMNCSGASSKDFLLVYTDLDGLKGINDNYGHTEGDDAIIAAAEILREAFEESDVIARIGGDEFVILKICNGSDNGDDFKTRIKAAVDSYNSSSDKPFKLSISVGAIRYSGEEKANIDELLKISDMMMYSEKQKKKNL